MIYLSFGTNITSIIRKLKEKMPEFKVITDIIPIKVSKKDFHPHEFEKKVNEHLNAGWRLVNCESIYLGGVSPRNGMHYWAYLVKD